jgi:tetratricopeptide (TPR) repeat protein
MGTLSYIYFRMERYEDAEPLAKEVLERRRRTLGDDNESTLFSMFNLGRIYTRSARWADAEPLLNEARTRYRRLRGDEDPYLFRTLAYLATVCANLGRLDEAERLAREAFEMPCADNTGYEAAKSSLVELLDRLVEMKEDGRD